jgi:hypothetical protein
MKCLPREMPDPMKSLLHLFHRGKAYFSGAELISAERSLFFGFRLSGVAN